MLSSSRSAIPETKTLVLPSRVPVANGELGTIVPSSPLATGTGDGKTSVFLANLPAYWTLDYLLVALLTFDVSSPTFPSSGEILYRIACAQDEEKTNVKTQLRARKNVVAPILRAEDRENSATRLGLNVSEGNKMARTFSGTFAGVFDYIWVTRGKDQRSAFPRSAFVNFLSDALAKNFLMAFNRVAHQISSQTEADWVRGGVAGPGLFGQLQMAFGPATGDGVWRGLREESREAAGGISGGIFSWSVLCGRAIKVVMLVCVQGWGLCWFVYTSVCVHVVAVLYYRRKTTREDVSGFVSLGGNAKKMFVHPIPVSTQTFFSNRPTP